MELVRSRTFTKQYKKLPSKVQQQFKERLRLWSVTPNHPILRVHPLKGKYNGYWSMSVIGDVRVIYYYRNEQVVVLALIGTHSQLC